MEAEGSLADIEFRAEDSAADRETKRRLVRCKLCVYWPVEEVHSDAFPLLALHSWRYTASGRTSAWRGRRSSWNEAC